MGDTTVFASIQWTPAQPVCWYSDVSARCWCEATIVLCTDGQWWHPASHGRARSLYCRETDS